MISRLTFAALAAMTLVAAPVAADPFDSSAQLCAEMSTDRCVEFQPNRPGITLAQYIAHFQQTVRPTVSLEATIRENGWDPAVVDGSLVFPAGETSRFIIA